jgi:pimeloyl-ACP methyl ester carboxylesterase
MKRDFFSNDGLRLSYLDAGGGGQALLALHAHFMEASTFAPLAEALAPAWRVFALDQRGHGDSEHARTYTRDDYLYDLAAFVEHLGLSRAVLLGNSLGGVNAYQFAGRFPAIVRGLVIEDIGVEIREDLSFALEWEGEYASPEAFAQRVGPRWAPYLMPSLRRSPGGWTLAFDPRELVISGRGLCGDHWRDWLATDCPALLVRGRDSPVTTQAALEQMAARRPNTRLVTLAGGHIVHADDPTGFVEVVSDLLRRVDD